MSKDRQAEKNLDQPELADDASVFEAVAEAAEDLDLELNPQSRLDKRMVGVFAAAVAHSSDDDGSDSPDASAAAPDTSSDNDEITKALQGWAETHPADVVKTYGDFTTEPYAAVMPGGVRMITKEYLTSWVGSADYKELLSIWSPKRERDTKLSNIQIVHLSQYVANATFQGHEIGEGEVSVIANGAAILIKDDSGQGKTAWKIAAVSKYGAVE